MNDAQIQFELFAPARTTGADGDNSTNVTLTLAGATRRFRMPKAGQSLLDAALENTLDAPYACKAGVCSTCRAKVLQGEVKMLTNQPSKITGCARAIC